MKPMDVLVRRQQLKVTSAGREVETREQENYAGNGVDPGDEKARPQRVLLAGCMPQSLVQL